MKTWSVNVSFSILIEAEDAKTALAIANAQLSEQQLPSNYDPETLTIGGFMGPREVLQ